MSNSEENEIPLGWLIRDEDGKTVKIILDPSDALKISEESKEWKERLSTGKTYTLDVGVNVNQDVLASYTLYKRVRDLHYFRGPLGTAVMSCTVHLPYGTVLNIFRNEQA